MYRFIQFFLVLVKKIISNVRLLFTTNSEGNVIFEMNEFDRECHETTCKLNAPWFFRSRVEFIETVKCEFHAFDGNSLVVRFRITGTNNSVQTKSS